jgi:hypothetical protein
VDIENGSYSPAVDNDLHLAWRYFVLEEATDKQPGRVLRGIVDDDRVVVRILLAKDALNIEAPHLVAFSRECLGYSFPVFSIVL